MAALKEYLYNYSLVDISLPGTHDSGAYQLFDVIGPGESRTLDDLIRIAKDVGLPIFQFVRVWGQAQNSSLYGQLMGGIRYIDFRVCISKGEWYTQHFLLGNPIQLLLNDILAFISTHRGEVLIIELGDFDGSTDAERKYLAQMIFKTLSPYLLPAPVTGSLRDITIGQMVQLNQRILMTSPFNLGPFLWNSTAYLCGSYADKSALLDMEAWNVQEINHSGGNTIFELSWTLTPQPRDIEKDLFDPLNKIKSLKDLAMEADGALPDFAKKYHNYKLGNILLVDWWEHADVVDVAISQNMRLCNDDPNFIPWNTNGQYCRNWFSNGNCTNPLFEKWMSVHCRLSCGYC